ncbi:MAG: PmoA family protein [Pirellulales bacterium]|nr:PmoA family protein [Pirellulales bacterium]
MSNVVVALAAMVVSAEPQFAWKQADGSLALVSGQQMVWQFNYRKEEGKPYFHPVTTAGSDCLTDLRPADHRWHRAIWFSWKTINGLIYWEEDPKTGKAPGETELVESKASARDDHSARFDLTLSYHPPGKPAVLTEKRILEISAPNEGGAYHIDWLSTFTAGDTDVVLDRTPIPGEPNGVGYGGYAGLSLRLAPVLKTWQFSDSEGLVKDPWKQARWIAFSGPLPDGKSAAIIVLDHPKSFRHPTPWYLIQSMPYFSPAVVYLSPYTLPAGQSISLRYRILFQPALAERETVEKQWQDFARE